MANVNLTVRIDENLKSQADDLFSDFGLSTNAAITMFIKQAVREQRIPFEVKRTQPIMTMASNDDVASISKKLIVQNQAAYEDLAK